MLFEMMARYNTWANARLHGACAVLSEADWTAPCGAAFGSLCGTLNHLLVADRIWLARFRGETDAPPPLDATIAEDRTLLWREREMTDRAIEAFVVPLTEAQLAARFAYRTINNPADVTQPLAPALAHFFNHQTHHRGQAHALLTRLAGAAPSFDLIVYQRETGDGL